MLAPFKVCCVAAVLLTIVAAPAWEIGVARASGVELVTPCKVLHDAFNAGDGLALSEATRIGEAWFLANDSRHVLRSARAGRLLGSAG